MRIIHSHLASFRHHALGLPRRTCCYDPHPLQPPLFWATLPNMGTSRWTPRRPLGTTRSREAPKGVTSGRDSATSPGQRLPITSVSPCEPECPQEDLTFRTWYKKGHFSLFPAQALRTEHLTVEASRKFGCQTSKKGKYLHSNPDDETFDGSREGAAGDARLAGDSNVLWLCWEPPTRGSW